MIGMRLLSLLAGAMVLVVPPMLMPIRGAGMPGWMVAGVLIGMALAAASFFYIGAAGKQMRRGGQARMLGGALLAVPAAASLALLATRTDVAQLCASGAVLAFTIMLFLNFVFAPTMGRRQRPMRARERHEAVVLQLRRR
jgi:protein-S-isoprenylcysteine O-methyltransferase Ste14